MGRRSAHVDEKAREGKRLGDVPKSESREEMFRKEVLRCRERWRVTDRPGKSKQQKNKVLVREIRTAF